MSRQSRFPSVHLHSPSSQQKAPMDRTALEEPSMSTTGKNESLVPGIMNIIEQRFSYVRRKNSIEKKPESAPVVTRMENGNGAIRVVERTALMYEKQKHKETRKVLLMKEELIERLHQELDEKNNDIEEFREKARDLTEQRDVANSTIEELEREVEILSQARAKAATQEERIQELERRLEDDTEGRRKAEIEVSQSKEALSDANRSIEKLNQSLLAALDRVDQKEEDAEAEEKLLRAQLTAANEALATKDEALHAAEEEKIALRTSLFDTRHNLEEATAVIGKASLSFNQEVSRFMNVLQTTRNSAIVIPDLSKVG